LCLSPRGVEQFLNSSGWPDELPRTVREHVAGCEHCTALVRSARNQDARFQREILPRTLPLVHAATSRPPLLRLRWALAAVAAAAVVAVCVSQLPLNLLHKTDRGPVPAAPAEEHSDPEELAEGSSYVGLKTAPTLKMHVRRDGRKFRFDEGMPLHPGDLVLLRPFPAGYDYLLLVHLDPAGETQVVYPWDGKKSAPAPKTGEALKDAFRLDDKIGQECFVAMFSRSRFSLGEAAKWLRGTKLPGIPAAGTDGRQVVSTALCYTKETR